MFPSWYSSNRRRHTVDGGDRGLLGVSQRTLATDQLA